MDWAISNWEIHRFQLLLHHKFGRKCSQVAINGNHLKHFFTWYQWLLKVIFIYPCYCVIPFFLLISLCDSISPMEGSWSGSRILSDLKGSLSYSWSQWLMIFFATFLSCLSLKKSKNSQGKKHHLKVSFESPFHS